MKSLSLKQRVLNAITKHASDFKTVFVDYDYLIYSSKFTVQPYYIVSANEINYKHLTGVVSEISPYEFFNRCLNGTMVEDDFGFILTKPDGTVTDLKSTVRKKIKALPYMTNFFRVKLIGEENFIRGRVSCALATSDNKITLGFEDRIASRPKTLLRGNEIKNAIDIPLILRRNRGDDKFDTIVQSDVNSFNVAFPDLLSGRLLL